MSEKYCILYNPKACNKTGEQGARKCAQFLSGNTVRLVDMTKDFDYTSFFANLALDEKLVIAGGDGTLNCFVNDSGDAYKSRSIYYFPAGSGNDFLRDVKSGENEGPIDITEYLRNLPTVTINGKSRRFINGIGYGIDGYCCEVADKLVAKSDKPVNYTAIAIKGLLFHYKPTTANVTVDGETKSYRNVWLAPTMNGRFYGGGMMPTPGQNRLSQENTVSCMVWTNRGRLSTLMAFPSIFKGEHIKHSKMIHIRSGHKVTVEFNRPVALQIDGETVLNVSSYTVTKE